MRRTAWTLILLVLVTPVACSEETSNEKHTNIDAGDAGTDSSTQDSASVDGADAATESFGLPLCTDIGVDQVLAFDTAIVNEFALSVMNDCRVIQLLLPLNQQEGGIWFEETAAWTGAFFGCPGTDGSVTSFGPVETGKAPVLSQADVDVLVEHFAVATEKFISLSSNQSAALRAELAKVAAKAVNVQISEHALSLCTDGGPTDAGADADGAADAPTNDATDDAETD